MAIIKPFRALKYKADNYRELLCPPYDIMDEDEISFYRFINKDNIINLELPENIANVRSKFNDMMLRKKLVKDIEPGLYIYEEEFLYRDKFKKVKGIICLVGLEEFSKKIILPHENTFENTKENRFNLLKESGCNFSPIYSLYDDGKGQIKMCIDEFSQRAPDIEFISYGNVIHRLWNVNEKEFISQIVNFFKDKKLYIADGHHRYEAALKYKRFCSESRVFKSDDFNYTMMFLVSLQNEGLTILPTHRLISCVENFDTENFINALKKDFIPELRMDLKYIDKILSGKMSQGNCVFGLFLKNNEWILLKLKKDVQAKLYGTDSLNVNVLRELILKPILNIDLKNNPNYTNCLSYTKNIDDAINLVNQGKKQCAFILSPMKISAFSDIFINDKRLPQKSTYFFPKPITGLIINKMDV